MGVRGFWWVQTKSLYLEYLKWLLSVVCWAFVPIQTGCSQVTHLARRWWWLLTGSSVVAADQSTHTCLSTWSIMSQHVDLAPCCDIPRGIFRKWFSMRARPKLWLSSYLALEATQHHLLHKWFNKAHQIQGEGTRTPPLNGCMSKNLYHLQTMMPYSNLLGLWKSIWIEHLRYWERHSESVEEVVPVLREEMAWHNGMRRFGSHKDLS